MIIGIYSIENIKNKKKYIGKSVDIERRFSYHKYHLTKNSHYNKHLQNSWNKDGEDNFNFEIIKECNKEELGTLEIHYIKLYKTKDSRFGFNLTDGGEGMLGHVPSKETRLKKSLALLGKKLPLERIKNISLSLIGKRVGDKNPNYGKHPSEETKRKNGNGMRNKKHSDETKEKMRGKRPSLSGENHPFFGKKKEGGSSNYFGVYKRIYEGKYVSWIVEFVHEGMRYHVGSYREEIIAAQEYDKYIIEYNLQRPLNFPKNQGLNG